MARTRENRDGRLCCGLIILTGATLMFAGERLWLWASGEATGDDALRVAIARRDTNAARRALRDGASIDARSIAGYTPLMTAAAVGDERFVTFLIAYGASVDAPGPQGFTALSLAVSMSVDDVSAMRALLRAGASPNGGNTSESRPLVHAVATGRYAAAELLLERGADPNLCGTCDDGASPLTAMAGAEGGANERIVRLLIAAGADVNRPDRHGMTPLRAATEAGDTALATILRQAGADARGGGA